MTKIASISDGLRRIVNPENTLQVAAFPDITAAGGTNTILSYTVNQPQGKTQIILPEQVTLKLTRLSAAVASAANGIIAIRLAAITYSLRLDFMTELENVVGASKDYYITLGRNYNQTERYDSTALSVYGANAAAYVNVPLPQIELSPGDNFSIYLTNLIVNDTITGIRAVFRRFYTA